MILRVGRFLAGAAALFLVSAAAFAADPGDPISVPKLTGRVVDLTGTLSSPQRESIAGKLAAFEGTRGSQVVVLLVPSIGTETIEEFATRVTDDWKLGRAGVDDGVLFVIAKQERKLRIQSGRGVQGTLTDAMSKRIIVERVSPKFRTGDFAGGIEAGVEAILKAIEGESLPPPAKKKATSGSVGVVSSFENFLWLAFLVVPVAGLVLRSLLGRFLGAGLTGGATGLAAGFIFGSVIFGAVAAIGAFILVLGMGSSRLASRGGGGGWTTGGFGGGGGGWSSGGGGFSGGGGGFDGGGASGDW
ncbi:MAG: TPM domain-containing protein [Betaproteobacteria bacterium]|nr:TPM domain-containing protein [Betaproteobacteria bacterium]